MTKRYVQEFANDVLESMNPDKHSDEINRIHVLVSYYKRGMYTAFDTVREIVEIKVSTL